MNYEEIKATIGELTRYTDNTLKRRDPRGAYVRSTIIPRATKGEFRVAEKLADPERTRIVYREWVPLKHIVTDQGCLMITSLRYAARTYPRHQREGKKLPTLVMIARNKYVLWDGNHRTTIGLMINPAMRIRAYVIRKRNRKNRLTRKRKHG